MTYRRLTRGTLSLVLVSCIANLGPAVSQARAELISTEAVVNGAAASEGTRARLYGLLEREEVRGQLEALGVGSDEARARIASLSDAEVEAIAGRLEELPAGGSGLGAVLVIVAVVAVGLAITDYLGITDIYPWVEERDRSRASRRR